MSGNTARWLKEFARGAESTDQFTKHPRHLELLALGLMGEAGSVLAEVKKSMREGPAYVASRMKVQEEIGDFLWYYVRLVSVLEGSLLEQLSLNRRSRKLSTDKDRLDQILEFGAVVGDLVGAVRHVGRERPIRLRDALQKVWIELKRMSDAAQIPLSEAARANSRKRSSRWPTRPSPLPRFDDSYPFEEQLPRQLEVEFLERKRKGRPVVILRINGLNIGDRLTDNIEEPDEYRYHDVFHFANAAFLGWSPVTRSLLRCKRKSKPTVDENEDGGRAAVIEEAISAVVFGRAKILRFFEGVNHLDYELLKNIQGLTSGYEVETIPLWQWEKAILKSYAVFRKLKANHGGRVRIDLQKRTIEYRAVSR